MKKFVGYRTYLFNALAALLPIADILVQLVQTVEASPQIRGMIPEGWMPWYLLAVAAANIVLRSRTSTAAGKIRKPKGGAE